MINEVLTIAPSPTANVAGAFAVLKPSKPFVPTCLKVSFPSGIGQSESLAISEFQVKVVSGDDPNAASNLITATVNDADGLVFPRLSDAPLSEMRFCVSSSIASSAATVQIELLGYD
jgi:hypothetical protein